MREYDIGRDIVTRPDPPAGLLRLLFNCSAGVSFITYSASSGLRKLAYVDSLIATVLCYMFLHETPREDEFDIGEITSGLEISKEDAARALMFMYIHGLVCEIQYENGTITYLLTNRGCRLAWDIYTLEDQNKCAWKVGIAIDDETHELIPILLCPHPPVIFG
jgi:predicted DNA-binding transcriptional regulator